MPDQITTEDLLCLVPLGDLISFYHLSSILASPAINVTTEEIQYAIVDYLASSVLVTLGICDKTPSTLEEARLVSGFKLSRHKDWDNSRLKNAMLKWFSAVSVSTSDPTVLDFGFGLLGGEPSDLKQAKQSLSALRMKVKSTIERSITELTEHRQRVIDQIRFDGIPGHWATGAEKSGFVNSLFPELPSLGKILDIRGQKRFLESMTEVGGNLFPTAYLDHRGRIDSVLFPELEFYLDPSMIKNAVASTILQQAVWSYSRSSSRITASYLAIASVRGVVYVLQESGSHRDEKSETNLIFIAFRSIASYVRFPDAISLLMTPKVAKVYYVMELEGKEDVEYIQSGVKKVKGTIYIQRGDLRFPVRSGFWKWRDNASSAIRAAFPGGGLPPVCGVNVFIQGDVENNGSFSLFSEDTNFQIYNSADSLRDFLSLIPGPYADAGKVGKRLMTLSFSRLLGGAVLPDPTQRMIELML